MATSLEDVLSPILSSAAGKLSDAGLVPGRIHLAPGVKIAWDDCCEGGGQLYLQVRKAVPGGDMRRAGKCGPASWVVTAYLGIIRCAHTVDDSGVPPSPDDLTGDALVGLDDMALLLDGLLDATLPSQVGALTPVEWNALGPDGGCAGGEWRFTFTTSRLCWVPEVEL